MVDKSTAGYCDRNPFADGNTNKDIPLNIHILKCRHDNTAITDVDEKRSASRFENHSKIKEKIKSNKARDEVITEKRSISTLK